MAWSNTALVEYLYGIRQTELKREDGCSEIVSERVEAYDLGGQVKTGRFVDGQNRPFSG
jgi:hypothetical protein